MACADIGGLERGVDFFLSLTLREGHHQYFTCLEEEGEEGWLLMKTQDLRGSEMRDSSYF